MDIPSLSLPAITLGLGLTANSYFVMANLGNHELGVVPVISSEEKRQKWGISAGKAAEMFDWFFYTAAPRFAATSTVSMLMYLTTAYLRRNDPASSIQVRLLCAAGALSIFPAPYTAIAMMPTNKRIISLGRRSASGDADVNSKVHVDEYQQDIKRWVNLNVVRFSSMTIAYVTALYAALL